LLGSDLKGFPFNKKEQKRTKLKNRQYFGKRGAKTQLFSMQLIMIDRLGPVCSVAETPILQHMPADECKQTLINEKHIFKWSKCC